MTDDPRDSVWVLGKLSPHAISFLRLAVTLWGGELRLHPEDDHVVLAVSRYPLDQLRTALRQVIAVLDATQ